MWHVEVNKEMNDIVKYNNDCHNNNKTSQSQQHRQWHKITRVIFARKWHGVVQQENDVIKYNKYQQWYAKQYQKLLYHQQQQQYQQQQKHHHIDLCTEVLVRNRGVGAGTLDRSHLMFKSAPSKVFSLDFFSDQWRCEDLFKQTFGFDPCA